MEKNFREVIRDIKEGEVWEGTHKNIECGRNGRIFIQNKDLSSYCNINMVFEDITKYKLRRKDYTFEEAWKAFEEGKEIESIGYRYKKIHEKDKIYSKIFKEWCELSEQMGIGINEIRNKWYIND